jgi:hypothetical protein
VELRKVIVSIASSRREAEFRQLETALVGLAVLWVEVGGISPATWTILVATLVFFWQFMLSCADFGRTRAVKL